jgi:hypothetical protein
VVVIFLIVGIAVLGAEIYAVRNNRKRVAERTYPARWRAIYRWQLAIGVPLALAAAFISYPVSGGGDHYKVSGVPFIVLAIDQRGWDYISPFGVLSLLMNFVTWLLLPALALWVWSVLSRSPQGMPNTSLERTREG